MRFRSPLLFHGIENSPWYSGSSETRADDSKIKFATFPHTGLINSFETIQFSCFTFFFSIPKNKNNHNSSSPSIHVKEKSKLLPNIRQSSSLASLLSSLFYQIFEPRRFSKTLLYPSPSTCYNVINRHEASGSTLAGYNTCATLHSSKRARITDG